MALDLNEILNSLQDKIDPADNLFAKLAEDTTVEPDAEDLEKIASAEEAGRMVARNLMEDLEKTAVSTVGMTPETGAPMNPGVAMPVNNADVNPEVLAQAIAVINQAFGTALPAAGGSLAAGSIGGVGSATLQAPSAPDQHPIVADAIGTVGREKTAADVVVGTIYNHFFVGDE
jgi:hypothetical protein